MDEKVIEKSENVVTKTTKAKTPRTKAKTRTVDNLSLSDRVSIDNQFRLIRTSKIIKD